MDSTAIYTLAGVLGAGVLAAIVNGIFNFKKTASESHKNEAETAHLISEAAGRVVETMQDSIAQLNVSFLDAQNQIKGLGDQLDATQQQLTLARQEIGSLRAEIASLRAYIVHLGGDPDSIPGHPPMPPGF